MLPSSILDSALDAVVTMDEHGVITGWNKQAVTMFGWTREEAVGRDMADTIIPPRYRQAHRDGLRRFRETGATSVMGRRIELHGLHRDGRELPIELTVAAESVDGRHAFSAFLRDLSERHRSEAELRDAAAQIMVSDRLAALGTLAAGVAHEINNPLTCVMLGVDAAARELQTVAAERGLGDRLQMLATHLREARDGAERVRRIVGDLRTFSRPPEERPGPVDLRVVLDSVVNLAANATRFRAQLDKQYDEPLLVHGSEARLGQVFLNLVLNAAHALPEDDAVHNAIRIRARSGPDRTVVVEIEDTGHGNPAEQLGKIFNPFFTTKPVGVGTGLGLWISHNIVTAASGTIELESTVGVGTTVRVTLPASDLAVPPREPESDEKPVLAPRSRILIVDDEAAIGRALTRLLEGHDVTFLERGSAAIELLRTDASFDLVLCDLMMPNLTGMDVYEQVCARLPEYGARFVFMTGGACSARAAAFIATSPRPCLRKPFRRADVEDVLLGERAGRAT